MTENKIIKCGTQADWMLPNEHDPIIELNVSETIAVRRFAAASKRDLLLQSHKASQDPHLKPFEVNDIKNAASILNAWLSNVIADCDNSLSATTKKD